MQLLQEVLPLRFQLQPFQSSQLFQPLQERFAQLVWEQDLLQQELQLEP